MGSPPHTRGRFGQLTAFFFNLRFTPAYAGKIVDRDKAGQDDRVHPRIRGEDLRREVGRQVREGSPPHTRGRSISGSPAPWSVRFTPAYAGKMIEEARTTGHSEVHPRIRGEDAELSQPQLAYRGSPPHTRGRSALYAGIHSDFRFTPAYAGKMVLIRCKLPSAWVHPRIRGED